MSSSSSGNRSSQSTESSANDANVKLHFAPHLVDFIGIDPLSSLTGCRVSQECAGVRLRASGVAGWMNDVTRCLVE